MSFIVSAIVGFIMCLIGVPIAMSLAKAFGIYDVIDERRARVYTLFGEVLGVISEPGLHFLWAKLGIKAALMPLFGKVHTVDLRLDQEYLRSQPVNSEEGAPMGIGIWYEMFISDPVAYLFKNIDPRGSLEANVGNSAVRCLSNLPLERMLVDRHAMSRTVREEVTAKSRERPRKTLPKAEVKDRIQVGNRANEYCCPRHVGLPLATTKNSSWLTTRNGTSRTKKSVLSACTGSTPKTR